MFRLTSQANQEGMKMLTGVRGMWSSRGSKLDCVSDLETQNKSQKQKKSKIIISSALPQNTETWGGLGSNLTTATQMQGLRLLDTNCLHRIPMDPA